MVPGCLMSPKAYRSIKEWPEQDRPREKLVDQGPGSLTDSELIAILLGSGSRELSATEVAKMILQEAGGIAGLKRSTISSLSTANGVGTARAAGLLAAIELGRRVQAAAGPEKVVIRGPEDIFKNYGYQYVDLQQEVFAVVVLDTANQVLAHKKITRGTLNQSLAHPREVFRTAIERSGNSVILIHNHPSGNPSPSQEDINLTKKMVQAGNIVGIRVVDHVIMAGNTFTSMASLGFVD